MLKHSLFKKTLDTGILSLLLTTQTYGEHIIRSTEAKYLLLALA